MCQRDGLQAEQVHQRIKNQWTDAQKTLCRLGSRQYRQDQTELQLQKILEEVRGY